MDKYDTEIATILSSPNPLETLLDHWGTATPLFAFVSPQRTVTLCSYGPAKQCGCLTMIRNNPDAFVAFTAPLTERILADTRLPNRPADITPDHLPIFAEWQRIIDLELHRS